MRIISYICISATLIVTISCNDSGIPPDATPVQVQGRGNRFMKFSGGPLLYFPCNGNAIDESGHNNNGTVSGATMTTDRGGNPNSAYAFDGWNNHIEIPDIIPSDISEFSVSLWVKPNETVTRRLCVYLGARSGEAWLQVGNSSFAFGAHPTDGSEPTVSAPAIAGVFAHIVANYRRGISMQIWVNGILRSQAGIGKSPLSSGRNTHDSAIGSYAPEWLDWGRQNGIYSWSGTIDQVRIYSRALNEPEIQALYNSGQ